MPLTKLNSASVIERLPTGSVLQTDSGTISTLITNATATYEPTNIKANITPQLSTSKILIHADLNGIHANTQLSAIGFAIYQGIEGSSMSLVKVFNDAGAYTHQNDSRIYGGSSSFNFITSSSIGNTNNNRFEIYFARVSGSGSVYINNYTTATNLTSSSITVQEIKQ